MKPGLLSVLAATFSATSAYYIDIIAINFDSRGTFHDGSASYIDRDFNDGCRDRYVPGVSGFCMDWSKRRGHFYLDGQRYCVSESYEQWVRGSRPAQDQGGIYYFKWDETSCTWPAKRSVGNESAAADVNSTSEGAVPGDYYQPFQVLSQS